MPKRLFPLLMQQDTALRTLPSLLVSHRMRFFGCPFTWRARGNEAIKLEIKVAIEFSFPLQRAFELWHSVQFLRRGYWWCAIFHYIQHSTLWTKREKALLTRLGDPLSAVQVESIQVEMPPVGRAGPWPRATLQLVWPKETYFCTSQWNLGPLLEIMPPSSVDSKTMFLKLELAYESLGDLVKIQILIQ